MKEIVSLIRKDLTIDYRSGSAVGSIFLYVVTSCFVVFLAFQEMDPTVWIVLFWLITLFSSLNTSLRSFSHEGVERQIYYYTAINAYDFLVAKLIYNIGQAWITVLLVGILLSLFSTFPIEAVGPFFLTAVLGAMGIAVTFTLVSAVCYRTRNRNTLMMVMSFPIIIPLLLPLIRLSQLSLLETEWADLQNSFLLLGGVLIIVLSLVLILFPYVWRE